MYIIHHVAAVYPSHREAVMKRTQIYLTMDQWRTLTRTSLREKTTVAELIRRAIDQSYSTQAPSHFGEALDAVTGIWADREDIPSSEAYVRALRDEDRLAETER